MPYGRATYAAIALVFLSIVIVPLASPGPVHAASVTANPSSTTVGSPVTINATGFAGRIATIHWDEMPVVQDIPIDEKGSFTASLNIPEASKGSHEVLVTDDSNWSESTASVTVTVLPKVKVFPEVGKLLDEITVLGSGFSKEERGIRVTWDNAALADLIATADTVGRWKAKIKAQASRGVHYIGAFGSVTSAAEVSQARYVCGPFAVADMVSGPVGTKVTLNGSGFLISEDGITITYDKVIATTNIVATSEGDWEDTIIIPPSTQGRHTIGVYGSDFTPIGIVPDIDFQVIPSIEIEVVTFIDRIRVGVLGAGFAAGEVVAITFDDAEQDVAPVADDRGSFESTFTVSRYKGREHTVEANGNKGNSAVASFVAEKELPTAPKLLLPRQDANITIFDSVGGVFLGTVRYFFGAIGLSKDPYWGIMSADGVKFDWSEPEDTQGVVYDLQIATLDRFSMPLLAKTGISASEYTLTRQDDLMAGRYFWRVRSVDDVGNESPWSGIREFQVTYMPMPILILSIAIPIIILVALGVVVVIWRSRRADW